MIEVKHIDKSFERFNRNSFDVSSKFYNPGKVNLIIGQSGQGKSSTS